MKALSGARKQMAFNAVAVLKHHTLLEPLLGVKEYKRDRLLVWCGPWIRDALDEHAAFGPWPFYQNHKDAIASWRERCDTCSMQICLCVKDGEHWVEVDFDYYSPAGSTRSAFGHACEFLSNLLWFQKTNPFKIREMLVARGIDVPKVA